jgi:hypothetical protein
LLKCRDEISHVLRRLCLCLGLRRDKKETEAEAEEEWAANEPRLLLKPLKACPERRIR